jgi:hypothetical protein
LILLQILLFVILFLLRAGPLLDPSIAIDGSLALFAMQPLQLPPDPLQDPLHRAGTAGIVQDRN